MKSSDWPELLAEYIEIKSGKPFEWGVFDCALFVSDWIWIATKRDPFKNIRFTYSYDSSMQEVLEKHGFESLEDAVNKLVGAPRDTVGLAQRGDIVLFESGNQDALGLVDTSAERFVAPGRDGLETYPLRLAKKCWEID